HRGETQPRLGEADLPLGLGRADHGYTMAPCGQPHPERAHVPARSPAADPHHQRDPGVHRSPFRVRSRPALMSRSRSVTRVIRLLPTFAPTAHAWGHAGRRFSLRPGRHRTAADTPPTAIPRPG